MTRRLAYTDRVSALMGRHGVARHTVENIVALPDHTWPSPEGQVYVGRTYAATVRDGELVVAITSAGRAIAAHAERSRTR